MEKRSDWRDGYLAYLAHERRLAALTRQHYGRDIDVLFNLTSGKALSSLRIHDIRRYVGMLHGKGLGGRSLARMLSAWRGLFNYLVSNHGFSDNPCAGLRSPNSVKRLPEALSPDETARLMEIPTDSVLAARDKAILELAYSSGLRLSELAGLVLNSISRTERQVTVTGKGGKTRIVPVGRKALAAVDAWLPLRVALAKENETALFVGRNGAHLGARAIQLRLKTWSLKQGMRISVHPHVLRHSFASHMLQSSSDLRGVQEMLGHASIASTQVYTHLDFQHLSKAYDSAHPRAKRR